MHGLPARRRHPPRRCRLRRLIVIALLACALSLGSAVAFAAGTRQEGSDTAYAGPGTETGLWSTSNRRLRLRVATVGSNESICLDAMLDWNTPGPGHYDSRVVRNCRLDDSIATDRTGNGYWEEPSAAWNLRDPDGMQRGWGYVLEPNLSIGNTDMFEDAGGGLIYRDPPATGAPGARVLTIYQNGQIKSCNSDPVDTDPPVSCVTS